MVDYLCPFFFTSQMNIPRFPASISCDIFYQLGRHLNLYILHYPAGKIFLNFGNSILQLGKNLSIM
jgi:hypothetical protein